MKGDDKAPWGERKGSLEENRHGEPDVVGRHHPGVHSVIGLLQVLFHVVLDCDATLAMTGR